MSKVNFNFVENGSVTTPNGFSAAGITAGLKRSGNPDMAMIFSRVPANFGAAFTSCTFAAAPVMLDRQTTLKSPFIQAVTINSGNANACTGSTGMRNAEIMCELTAAELNIAPEAVMVSSTGRIGVQMPMQIISDGIKLAAKSLSENGGLDAAGAIMTTDTVRKSLAVQLEIDGKIVSIGAMTKGAGMIDPKMVVPHATMLCYITTDAKVSNALLNEFVGRGVNNSFNRITVDGDMSTNDTTILMANGLSGVEIKAGTPQAELFFSAVQEIMQRLAKMMVMDGEGATKFVTIKIVNAKDDSDAKLAAEAIGNSLLCKTAWFGCDPNWGRVVAALGYSTAAFDAEKVNIFYDDYPVVKAGGDAGTPEATLAEVLKKREFTILVDLNAGNGEFWGWSCDISYEYVKINAEYNT